MRGSRRAMVWVVAVMASVSLTGAGALAQPRSAQASHTVKIVSKGIYGPYAFSPKSTSVAKGQSVTWTNGSGTKHHLKFTNGTAWAKSVQAGQSISRTFHSKGTFHYHCTIHPYMKGTVTVT